MAGFLSGFTKGAAGSAAFFDDYNRLQLARDQFNEQKRANEVKERQTDDQLAISQGNLEVNQKNVDQQIKNSQITNRINEAKEKRAQEKRDQENTLASNNQFYDELQAKGHIATSGLRLNGDKIKADFDKGDVAAQDTLLTLASMSGLLPEGSSATGIVRMPSGGFAVTVSNADGTKGAVTKDGSSAPESTVVEFEPGQLVSLANLAFLKDVVANTDRINPGLKRNLDNVIEADSAANQVEQDYKKALLLNEIYKNIPAGEQQRNLASIIAKADGDPEAENQIITEAAENLGITDDDIDPDAYDPAVAYSEEELTKFMGTGRIVNEVMQKQFGLQNFMLQMEELEKNGSDPKRLAEMKQALPLILQEQKDLVLNEKTRREKSVESKAKVKTALRINDKRKLRRLDARLAQNLSESEREKVEKEKAEFLKENNLSPESTADMFIDAADDTPEAEAETKLKPSENPALEQKFTIIDDMDGDEIFRAVQNGEVRFSSQEIAETRRLMQAQKINELEDLLKLSRKDQARARAAIIASAEGNPSQQEAFRQEMSNLFDGLPGEASVSVSEKDRIVERGRNQRAVTSAQQAAKTYDLAVKKYEDGQISTAADLASELTTAANEAFFDENGKPNLNEESAKAFVRSGVFNQLYTKFRKAEPGTEISDVYMDAINSSVSLVMAALAGEESGTLIENVYDFFARGEVEDSVSSLDFDLRRVTVDDPKNPKRVFYTDEDGNKLDESVSLQDVKDLSPQVYNVVYQQAIANAQALARKK